jgi:hypothetical protein
MTLAEATVILEHLDAIDGLGLYTPPGHRDEHPMVSWVPGAHDIFLFHCRFTVDELEAFVVWIRAHPCVEAHHA